MGIEQLYPEAEPIIDDVQHRWSASKPDTIELAYGHRRKHASGIAARKVLQPLQMEFGNDGIGATVEYGQTVLTVQ